ncbi:MAG: hypothetical protein R6U98_03370 [Pirellulaceae bacterium]
MSGWKAARRKPSSRWSDSRRRNSSATGIYFRRLDFFRLESCPTQAVLPLVGLAAEKVIRDRYVFQAVGFFPSGKLPDASRPPVGRTRGGESHPRPVCVRGCPASGWHFGILASWVTLSVVVHQRRANRGW